MQTIGDKIRELRKQKGVSQEETAFELGVTRQTVSKWESGLMQPNAESIKALSDYFAVSPECFFGEETVEEVAVSAAKPLNSKRKKAFKICLGLLVVFSVLLAVCAFASYGIGCFVFDSKVGYDVVSDFEEPEVLFALSLAGGIISLGAIVGLIVALVKLRK